MTNSRLIPSLALLVGTLFIWATALAAKHEPAAGKDEPVGTVEIEEKEFRLILGGQKGSGVLHIQGNKYPFKVGGITH